MKLYKTLTLFLLISTTCILGGCTSKEVKELTTKIDNLGEITLDSGNELSQIYSDYLALSEADQEKISNYEKLESAMTEYNKIAADSLISLLDTYTFETIDELSAGIDSLWEYLDNTQKESALIALGRCQMEKEFENKIKTRLKSPDSFNLYSYEDSGAHNLGEYCTSIVTIKYGATNSFGAEITSTLTASIQFEIDIANKSVTFTNILCPELDF